MISLLRLEFIEELSVGLGYVNFVSVKNVLDTTPNLLLVISLRYLELILELSVDLSHFSLVGIKDVLDT